MHKKFKYLPGVLLLTMMLALAFGVSTSSVLAQGTARGLTKRTAPARLHLSSAVESTFRYGRSDGTSDKSFHLELPKQSGFQNERATGALETEPRLPTNYRLNSNRGTPTDETSVAARKKNIVVGANDYRLGFSYDGFYASPDKGQTWQDGIVPIPILFNDLGVNEPAVGGGDPAVAIARDGTVYESSLGYSYTFCENGLFVYRSDDKGMNWSMPDPSVPFGTAVYWDSGDSCFSDSTKPDVFHDKEYIAVDNSRGKHDGRVYMTWTKYECDGSCFTGGNFLRSAIDLAYSDDRADTWTVAGEINGANSSLCTYPSENAGRCDQDQASTPIVGPDGSIYVAFLNYQNEACWAPGAQPGDIGSFRSQYMVVKVNPDSFAVDGPHQVACLVDGIGDYPVNSEGDQVLSNSNFRVWAAGNIARNSSGDLYVVWSDNRNGANLGKDNVTTNSDVFAAVGSSDARVWSDPIRVNQDRSTSDQWFPWVATHSKDATVIYYDRRRDPANLLTNAFTSNTADSFAKIKDKRLSNSNFNPNYAFYQGLFIGDYLGIAFRGCNAFGAWADARRATFNDRFSDIYGAQLNVCKVLR